MTICVGLRASDGVVIAADSEESDYYFKRAQQKILTYMGPIVVGNAPTVPLQLACAFTGAGDAGYLDSFFDYVMRDIQTNTTQAELLEYLEKRIRIFHKKHLFPLSSASNPPEIDVLVGAYCQHQTSLFVSRASAMRRGFPNAAVGAGAHFAMNLINELPFPRDVKHAELLAAYIVGATKESVSGCGKYTAIVSLHNSTVSEGLGGEPSRLVPPQFPLTHVEGGKIRRWEEPFGRKWSSRQGKLIEELIEEELADDGSMKQ